MTSRRTEKNPPLELLQRCYRLLLLRARERAGVTLDLLELDELYRLDRDLRSEPEGAAPRAAAVDDDADGDDEPERRTFRRERTALPATVAAGAGEHMPTTVLDLSGSGALVDTGETLSVGDKISLRLGRAGATATRYVFPCEVVREVTPGEVYALRFCGTPLEVRYQSYASREMHTSWLLGFGEGVIVGNG